MRWWWIDTRWGCGGIGVEDGCVVDSAPIFKKLRGQTLEKLRRTYRVEPLPGSGKE